MPSVGLFRLSDIIFEGDGGWLFANEPVAVLVYHERWKIRYATPEEVTAEIVCGLDSRFAQFCRRKNDKTVAI